MIGNAIAGLYGGGVPPVTTAYESIQTYTVGAGGQTTITFSSIPSTYKHLQLRVLQKSSDAGSNISNKFQFNGDTTSTNYREHTLYGVGSGTPVSFSTQQWYLNQGGVPGGSDGANVFGVAVIDILDYANTNKYKVTRSLAGFDSNGSGDILLDSQLWMNTNAITSITMEAYTVNFVQYSHFALYGIKGA